MDMLQIFNFDYFILGGGLSVFIFISLLAYESVSHSVMPNSLQPRGLQPTGLLCPWTTAHQSPLSVGFSRQGY